MNNTKKLTLLVLTLFFSSGELFCAQGVSPAAEAATANVGAAKYRNPGTLAKAAAGTPDELAGSVMVVPDIAELRKLVIDDYKFGIAKKLAPTAKDNQEYTNATFSLAQYFIQEGSSDLAALPEEQLETEITVKNMRNWLQGRFWFEQELFNVDTGKFRKARTPNLDKPDIPILKLANLPDPYDTKLGKLEKLYLMILKMTPDNTEVHHMRRYLQVVKRARSKFERQVGMGIRGKLTLKKMAEKNARRISGKFLTLYYEIEKKLDLLIPASKPFTEKKDKKALKRALKAKEKFEKEFGTYGIRSEEGTSETVALAGAIDMELELYYVNKDNKFHNKKTEILAPLASWAPSQKGDGKIERFLYVTLKIDPTIIPLEAATDFLKALLKMRAKFEDKMKLTTADKLKGIGKKRIKPDRAIKISKKYRALLYEVNKKVAQAEKLLKTKTKLSKAENKFLKAQEKFNEEFRKYGIDEAAADRVAATENSIDIDVEIYEIVELENKNVIVELQFKIEKATGLVERILPILVVTQDKKAYKIEMPGTDETKKVLVLVDDLNSEMLSHTKSKLGRPKSKRIGPQFLRGLARDLYLPLLFECKPLIEKLKNIKNLKKAFSKVQELINSTLVNTVDDIGEIRDKERGIHIPVRLYFAKKASTDKTKVEKYKKQNPGIKKDTMKLELRVNALNLLIRDLNLTYISEEIAPRVDPIFLKEDFEDLLKEIKDIHKTIKNRCKTGLTKALTLTRKKFENPEKARVVASKYIGLLFNATILLGRLSAGKTAKMSKTAKYLSKRAERIGIAKLGKENQAKNTGMFMDVEIWAVNVIDDLKKAEVWNLSKKVGTPQAQKTIQEIKPIKGKRLALQIEELKSICDRITGNLGATYLANYLKRVKKVESDIKSHTKRVKVGRIKPASQLKLVVTVFIGLLWKIDFELKEKIKSREQLTKTVEKYLNYLLALSRETAGSAETEQRAMQVGVYLPVELYVIKQTKEIKLKITLLTGIVRDFTFSQDKQGEKNKKRVLNAVLDLTSKKLKRASKSLKALQNNKANEREAYFAFTNDTALHPKFDIIDPKSKKYPQGKIAKRTIRIFEKDIKKYQKAHDKLIYAQYILAQLPGIEAKIRIAVQTQKIQKSKKKSKKYNDWLDLRSTKKTSLVQSTKKYQEQAKAATQAKSTLENSLQNAPKSITDKLRKIDKKKLKGLKLRKAKTKIKSIRPDKTTFLGLF